MDSAMTNNSNNMTAAKSSADLEKLRINHPRIKELASEMQTLIYPNSQSNTLLVVGPTGVGKSTLCKHLVEESFRQHQEMMEQDANIVPAAYVQAPSSGETGFSWRLFYERILNQLEGNALGLSRQASLIHKNTLLHPQRSGRTTLAGLRTAVERALHERQTQFLVIDEAAHIIHQTSARAMCVQLDTLKSLANECGTQIVLAGSYDLYQLMSLSAQLARRTHVLHFERYRQDQSTDVRAFQICLRHFESVLPHLWKDQLVPHTEALMENSLGCIGTLSSMLIRAARLAEKDGGWSDSALERALLTQAQVQQIVQEITAGELDIAPSLERRVRSQERKRA